MKNSVATVPGRNGGRLNAGGTPGNKGGTGRPKDRIKAALSDDLEEGLQQIGEALRAEELTVAEKQKHMEVALRYTLPVPKNTVDEDSMEAVVTGGTELRRHVPLS